MLFLLNSIWFDVLSIVAIIIIISILHSGEYNYNNYIGTSTTISFILFWSILFFVDHDSFQFFFKYIISHPLTIVFSFLIYLIVGVGWSFVKWYEFLLYKKSKYFDAAKRYKTDIKDYIPQLSEHKIIIIRWMFWWPFSLLWFAINKPIKKIFTGLFEWFKDEYQRMINKVFKFEEINKEENK